MDIDHKRRIIGIIIIGAVIIILLISTIPIYLILSSNKEEQEDIHYITWSEFQDQIVYSYNDNDERGVLFSDYNSSDVVYIKDIIIKIKYISEYNRFIGHICTIISFRSMGNTDYLYSILVKNNLTGYYSEGDPITMKLTVKDVDINEDGIMDEWFDLEDYPLIYPLLIEKAEWDPSDIPIDYSYQYINMRFMMNYDLDNDTQIGHSWKYYFYIGDQEVYRTDLTRYIFTTFSGIYKNVTGSRTVSVTLFKDGSFFYTLDFHMNILTDEHPLIMLEINDENIRLLRIGVD
jgi:hypothetical protein